MEFLRITVGGSLQRPIQKISGAPFGDKHKEKYEILAVSQYFWDGINPDMLLK